MSLPFVISSCWIWKPCFCISFYHLILRLSFCSASNFSCFFQEFIHIFVRSKAFIVFIQCLQAPACSTWHFTVATALKLGTALAIPIFNFFTPMNTVFGIKTKPFKFCGLLCKRFFKSSGSASSLKIVFVFIINDIGRSSGHCVCIPHLLFQPV